MKFIKPEESELQSLLDVATKEQTAEQWVDNFTSSVVYLIKENPAYYRSFGPWWWQVKQAIINYGKSIFEDDSIDKEWLDKTKCSRFELSLVAAWAFSEANHLEGNHHCRIHLIDTDQGTEEYVITDNDVEIMIGV